jgi:hypothetical protein
MKIKRLGVLGLEAVNVMNAMNAINLAFSKPNLLYVIFHFRNKF